MVDALNTGRVGEKVQSAVKKSSRLLVSHHYDAHVPGFPLLDIAEQKDIEDET